MIILSFNIKILILISNPNEDLFLSFILDGISSTDSRMNWWLNNNVVIVTYFLPVLLIYQKITTLGQKIWLPHIICGYWKQKAAKSTLVYTCTMCQTLNRYMFSWRQALPLFGILRKTLLRFLWLFHGIWRATFEFS